MSLHFLVLDTPLDYAILGSVELENSQSIICLACRSICSLLPYNGIFKWLTVMVYLSPALQHRDVISICGILRRTSEGARLYGTLMDSLLL